MKNFKSLIIIVVAIGWIGCNRTIKKELPERNTKPPLASAADTTVHSFQQTILLFNNPFLFGGGSGGFGPFFMVLIKTQQYDMAVKFTSRNSKKKFGEQALLNLYKNLRINYTLRQVSYRKDADTFLIRFTTREYATSKYKDMKIDIEGDTCRLVIDRLDKFLK